MKMLYTANGRYIRCCTEEGTRPVIIVCEKEYEVDVQEFMLWSISPFREFLNKGFVFRNRATYGSLVEIGLKRQTNPEGKDYSVATFKWLGDFHGEQLAAVRKYALSFREQIRGMNRQRIEAKREQDDGLCEVESYTAAPAAADDSFCIGATVNGDTQPLPA